MIKHANPKIQHHLELLVIVAAIGVLVLIAIEFFIEMDPQQKLVLQIVNLIILLVFLVELLYNLYYAEEKGKYLKTHWLDVIAVLPILEVFRLSKIAGISRTGLIFGAARGTEVVELAELSKIEKITELSKLEKTTQLERVYEGIRAFWHEKLAFGDHHVVSLPVHHRKKRGHVLIHETLQGKKEHLHRKKGHLKKKRRELEKKKGK